LDEKKHVGTRRVLCEDAGHNALDGLRGKCF